MPQRAGEFRSPQPVTCPGRLVPVMTSAESRGRWSSRIIHLQAHDRALQLTPRVRWLVSGTFGERKRFMAEHERPQSLNPPSLSPSKHMHDPAREKLKKRFRGIEDTGPGGFFDRLAFLSANPEERAKIEQQHQYRRRHREPRPATAPAATRIRAAARTKDEQERRQQEDEARSAVAAVVGGGTPPGSPRAASNTNSATDYGQRSRSLRRNGQRPHSSPRRLFSPRKRPPMTVDDRIVLARRRYAKKRQEAEEKRLGVLAQSSMLHSPLSPRQRQDKRRDYGAEQARALRSKPSSPRSPPHPRTALVSGRNGRDGGAGDNAMLQSQSPSLLKALEGQTSPDQWVWPHQATG